MWEAVHRLEESGFKVCTCNPNNPNSGTFLYNEQVVRVQSAVQTEIQPHLLLWKAELLSSEQLLYGTCLSH